MFVFIVTLFIKNVMYLPAKKNCQPIFLDKFEFVFEQYS